MPPDFTVLMASKAPPAGEVSQQVLDYVRNQFVKCREIIVSCSKPWPPWALVELLNIDDSNESVPAELILYKALRHVPRMGIQIKDEVVQVFSSHLFVQMYLFNVHVSMHDNVGEVRGIHRKSLLTR